nr:reverse transcriptase domain-containing protein [Tanacetum cinerariifolium]
MPKRWLSATRNRLEGRISVRIPLQMLPGRIQRLSSNTNGKREKRKNSVHHKPRNILLYKDAFRPKECWINLPTTGGQSIPQTDQQKPRKEEIFLVDKINTKRLKVCPDKVDAVLNLPSPKCLKDVQWSNGKLASLKRALRGPELNYTPMEKLVLALVHTSKRLKRYFQAHPIIVITDQPIQQMLSRPKVAGRLHKWIIELGEYAIHYRPRMSVKKQILADFIVERPEEDSLDTLLEVEEKLPEPWI